MSADAHSTYQNVVRTARDHVRSGLELSDTIMQQVAEAAPGELRRRMLQLSERKGKRIRSTLLFLLAETGPVPHDPLRVAKAAASVEMLHLASLVHDDVIDESPQRRGVRTAHAEWGNKLAVLVGDYILSKSMELVVDEADRRVPSVIAKAASALIAGEIMEIDLAGRRDLSMEQYMEVIDGKTASLVDACARCGAILAGHTPEMVDAFGQLGSHFGIAFQIIDDLLDYGVGADDLGKAKFSDLGNGLTTLPLLLYMQNCSSEEKATLEDLLSKASEPGVAPQIVQLLQKKDCFERAKEMALERLADAAEILSRLPESKARDLLIGFFAAMAERSN